MKQLFLVFTLFFLTQISFAQAPLKFSFQGVARDATGKVIAGSLVKLRLTIRKGTVSGNEIYQEIQQANTSANGVFSLAIGSGASLMGQLSEISWKDNSYFLQVELDPMGGSDYYDMGTTQLMSVPYAMFANEAGRWKDYETVIQKGVLPSYSNDWPFPGPDIETRLIWMPSNGSFRAGATLGDNWDLQKTGSCSFATGANNIASGNLSVAMGLFSQALGHGSFALGDNLISKATDCFTIGTFNNDDDQPDPSNSVSSDRLFQIGNGIGLAQNGRSNALTLLKNGNLGLGEHAVSPEYILDVDGRARVRHNKQSAGIYFNNSLNQAKGFVGMVDDTQIGLFLDGWKFYVKNDGNATLTGVLTQSSDRRLKRNFSPLSESLSKLTSLQGYHYFWKDTLKDQTTQTGLIAQEVETLFPELVKTDDKGFKAVNYIGLVPHLIEAVKELEQANEVLKKQNQRMETEVGKTSDAIKSLEAKLDQLQQKLLSDLNTDLK
jgi:hypothetical protein